MLGISTLLIVNGIGPTLVLARAAFGVGEVVGGKACHGNVVSDS